MTNEEMCLDALELCKKTRIFIPSNEILDVAINSIQENTNLKAENEELKAELEQSIKLPCKAGDIVYTVYNVKGREPVISENKFTLKYYADNINYFGKTIFLTREEAEERLKEMSE